MNLINSAQIKKLVIELSKQHRQGKFNRTSKQFLAQINNQVYRMVYESVKNHPTIGKTITEFKKGKKVVLVYPIDKWVLMLLDAGAEVKNLGDVKWCAVEDGSAGKGTGRWIAEFILDPEKASKS